MAVFEAGTTDPGSDILAAKTALSHIGTRCSVRSGYSVGEPVSRFGWTFFPVMITQELIEGIEREFGDMISKYREGKPEERLERFLSDYLDSRGCKIRLKLKEY